MHIGNGIFGEVLHRLEAVDLCLARTTLAHLLRDAKSLHSDTKNLRVRLGQSNRGEYGWTKR